MENWTEELKSISTLKELDDFRVASLGKKGFITIALDEARNIADDKVKKDTFKNLNIEKSKISKDIEKKKIELQTAELKKRIESEKIDMSLFDTKTIGSLHPIGLTIQKMTDYFISLNYSIHLGPMIENDFYNFSALNLSEDHPARDMQDTFYLNDGMLLRTHTSAMQIKTLEKNKLPIKMISPGAVFRRDFDITHTPMFHQIEGLVVAEKGKINFAHLKQSLNDFLHHMFGDKIKIRFRSSFFPFTEPSAEVDISCVFCDGKGCQVCSKTGWLEILGCGMTHQNVFKSSGIKEEIQGFAFGMGIERIAMLTYAIPDLRAMYQNDIKLLEQFR